MSPFLTWLPMSTLTDSTFPVTLLTTLADWIASILPAIMSLPWISPLTALAVVTAGSVPEPDTVGEQPVINSKAVIKSSADNRRT
jgi:hypothetical protein